MPRRRGRLPLLPLPLLPLPLLPLLLLLFSDSVDMINRANGAV